MLSHFFFIDVRMIAGGGGSVREIAASVYPIKLFSKPGLCIPKINLLSEKDFFLFQS